MLRTTIIILTLSIIACNNDSDSTTIKEYFTNGEIKNSLKVINDSCFEYSEYYMNGTLKEKGTICNEIKQGIWEEFYADGEEKWKGEFIDGERDLPLIPDNAKPLLTFESGEEYLIKGEKTKARLTVEGFHPEDYSLFGTNCIVKFLQDSIYNVEITALERKPIKLNLGYKAPDGIRYDFFEMEIEVVK